MDTNRVTVRFAKALFQASLERNKLDEILHDVFILSEALKNYKGFKTFIDSPFIKPSEKQKKIEELFKRDFNPLTIKFIKLVIDRNRELYFEGIFRNFIDYAYKEKGITKAELTMAVKIDHELVKRLVCAFENRLGTRLELNQKEDEKIIGGFVFRVAGYQYDASVVTKLNEIRKSFKI